jgi:hypothetical protein
MPALSKQDAIVKVRLTTTKRLAEDLQNGTKPQDIDIDLTFTGNYPKDGYGRTPQRYLHLCTVIADDLRNSTHRDLYLTIAFVDDHEAKPISDFIFDAADLLLKAKQEPYVAAAQAWASQLPPRMLSG